MHRPVAPVWSPVPDRGMHGREHEWRTRRSGIPPIDLRRSQTVGADMPRSPPRAVTIVTGGSRAIGRQVALALGCRGDAVAVVYLDDQARAEATVDEILAVGGTAVAVRADLKDPFDVERLFTETVAMFGDVDVVVDTTRVGDESLLGDAARRRLRRGSALITRNELGPDANEERTVAGLV